MTSLHGAIRALFVADTAVAALVSNRIYPVRMPINATYPAILTGAFAEENGGA